MMQRFIDYLIDAVTSGNRPMRIFFFGGVFLALFMMTMLSKFFGANTNIGGDIKLLNVILIIASLFIGFGVSFAFINFADAIKRQRKPDRQE